MVSKHTSAWPHSYSVSKSWLRTEGQTMARTAQESDEKDREQGNSERAEKGADSSLLLEAELSGFVSSMGPAYALY